MDANYLTGVLEVLDHAAAMHNVEVIFRKSVAEYVFAAKNCFKCELIKDSPSLSDPNRRIIQSVDLRA